MSDFAFFRALRAEQDREDLQDYLAEIRDELQAEHDAEQAALPEDERLATPYRVTLEDARAEKRRRDEHAANTEDCCDE